MPDAKKPNAVEAAEWEIQGDTRLSDEAISALAELALDLVESDGTDVSGAGDADDPAGE